MKKQLEEYASVINKRLDEYLSHTDSDFGVIHEAMRYSTLSNGKRIRGFLLTEFFRLYSKHTELVLPFACAVELIHAYSLIHDDLPCMDDDDLRRGQPTCHKKYGEATALLAGDALLTLAFEIISADNTFDPKTTIRIIQELSSAAGHSGMIGGQIMDIENKGTDIVRLIKLNLLKTGHLIMAAARIGSIAGGALEDNVDIATEYAKNLGLAFQITDDILDVQGNAEKLGKSIGSDAKNNKVNFVTMLGIENAKEYADTLSIQAILGLEKLKEGGKDTANLENLVKMLAERDT